MTKLVAKSGLNSIFCLIFIPICGLLLLFTFTFYTLVINYHKEHIFEEMTSRGRLILGTLQKVNQILGDGTEFRRVVSSLGAENDLDTIVVASGSPVRVITATNSEWVDKRVDQLPAPYLNAYDLSKVIDEDKEVIRVENGLFLNLSLPMNLVSDREPTRKMAIFLHFDLARVNQIFDKFKSRVIAACLSFLSIVALFVGFLIRKLINQPLTQLVDMINKSSETKAEDIGTKFVAAEFDAVIKSFVKLQSDDRGNRELLRERNELLEDSNSELVGKNELIAAIVENIPVAVFLKDIKNDFRVTVWNSAAEKIFEVPRAAILGKSAHDLWPKEQADLYLAADQEVAERGVAVDIQEEPSHSKTRGTIFLRTQKLPLTRDCSNRSRYLLCICDDITDRKRTQESLELERAKSLRNAKLASLGELAAGIAHEINNPLTIIYGTVRVLPKFVNSPENLATRIESIQAATERISRIVRSLRKFSRTSDQSDYQVHSLCDIVKESLVLTEAKARRHSTRVEVDFKTDGLICCDEIEMEQVFVNLINNAIDAVQMLAEKWVKLDLQDVDGRVVLRIQDSGPQISHEVQKKLFQPFFTTKPVGQGTGLGLSIVKGILDEHHATIELVASEANTCFEICFPKAEGKTYAA